MISSKNALQNNQNSPPKLLQILKKLGQAVLK